VAIQGIVRGFGKAKNYSSRILKAGKWDHKGGVLQVEISSGGKKRTCLAEKKVGKKKR